MHYQIYTDKQSRVHTDTRFAITTLTLVLSAYWNKVHHWWIWTPLCKCSQELPSLREPNWVISILELWIRFYLCTDIIDLLIGIHKESIFCVLKNKGRVEAPKPIKLSLSCHWSHRFQRANGVTKNLAVNLRVGRVDLNIWYFFN